MRKILHVITGLNVGGAERALHSLLTGGLQNHFDNRVLSLTGPGHYGPLLEDAGIAVTALNISAGVPTPGDLWHLRSAIRATSPDLIQGWMYHGNLATTAARWLDGRPTTVVWNVRRGRDDIDEMKASTNHVVKICGWLSSDANAIIYNSVRSRTQHEAENFSGSAAHVIPNGFDIDLWRPDDTAAIRLRHKIGLPADKLIVGYVARAHPEKDPANLFSAFARVAQSNSSCHLVCVGAGLAEVAPRDLDLSRVSFLGERHDMATITPAFDLFCLSSCVEGFPNVLGEAMACGVPCITTDVGDAAEIVRETGWVAPPRDSPALAAALLQALTLPLEKRKELGIAARLRVEANYSLPSIVSRYVALYGDLLSAM